MCKTVLNRARPWSTAPAPIRMADEARAPEAPTAPVAAAGYREAPRAPGGPALVFFDPPHASTLDLPAVAELLRVHVSDARMRVGAPAPLPVLMLEETDAERAASALRRAGASAAVAPVEELLATPATEDLARFAVDATRILLETRTAARGELAWHELRAAFLVVETVFVQGPDSAGRAAAGRASAELDRAWSHWSATRNRTAARRSLRRIGDDLALAGAVRRDERTDLSLHLVGASTRGRVHLVCPMASASTLVDGIARYAPDVKLDRRAERAPLRLPPIAGIAAVFDGQMPSAAELMGAYLAWKHTR
jgi:hypothetical protein